MTPIESHLTKQLDKINQAIKSQIREIKSSKFNDAAEYAIYPEGKRYRSFIALEIYRILGGLQTNVMKGIVGLEMIHHASLIFDDLPCMDNSPMRKGKSTTHLIYGENMAILAGLYLNEKGRQLLHNNAREHLTKIEDIDTFESLIHQTLIKMYYGQEIDLKKQKTEKELSQYIILKNSLFSFATLFPSYFLRKTQHLTELKNIGKNLAEAYQLFDDLRDIKGNEKIIGKLKNIDEGKDTTVSVYGVKKVEAMLQEKIQIIRDNIGKLPQKNRLQEIVNYIFETPS